MLCCLQILTKAITAALISAFGNLMCQLFVEKKQSVDWQRLAIFTTLAFVYIAPMLHFWFGALSCMIPAQGNTGELQDLPFFVVVVLGRGGGGDRALLCCCCCMHMASALPCGDVLTMQMLPQQSTTSPNFAWHMEGVWPVAWRTWYQFYYDGCMIYCSCSITQCHCRSTALLLFLYY